VRVYLIGAGSERGLALTRSLVAEGHAVRGVTRTEARRAEIEGAGAECWIGDPDVVGTLRMGLENVTVLFYALGGAFGDRDAIAPLYGSRLKMLLEKTTDTTVRGVVYERSGTVDDDLLQEGADVVRWAFETNEIPYAWVDHDATDVDGWVTAARTAIDSLLGAERATPVR
jgi:nucleoside-diphosphate-sugar epimerase